MRGWDGGRDDDGSEDSTMFECLNVMAVVQMVSAPLPEAQAEIQKGP